MGIRVLLLSGIAAFGLGLVALGGVFHEPGDGASRRRPQVQPASTAIKWELWQPARPDPAPAAGPDLEPELVMAPDPDRPPDPVLDADEDAGPPSIWETPEVWSAEE